MNTDVEHSRRSLMRAVSIGALVIGFDAGSRSWASDAGKDAGLDRLPPLDGRLLSGGHQLQVYPDRGAWLGR